MYKMHKNDKLKMTFVDVSITEEYVGTQSSCIPILLHVLHCPPPQFYVSPLVPVL